jgi:anti-anti-sigma factor
VVHDGGGTVIHVRGEIDMDTAGRLRDAIEPHLGPRQSVVLDLSGVRYMDSSCLNLLVQARGRLTEDGGSLVLRSPSEVARRVLTAGRMEDLLAAAATERARERRGPAT